MRGFMMRPISKALCFFSIGLLMLAMDFASLCASAQSKQANLPETLKGEWVLASFYKTKNIWGLGPEQAKALVGSKLKYEIGFLTACKQRAQIEKVDEKEVTAAEFLAGRNTVHFSDVEIYAASVKEITINGNSSGNCFDTHALPGEDIYVKSKDELLIDFEGVYFRALRSTSASGK